VRETEGEIFYESAKCGKMGLKNKKIPMRPFYTEKDIKRKKLKQWPRFPPVSQFVKSPRNKNQYFKRCNPVRTMLFFSPVTETDKSAKINLINKS